MEDFLKKHNLSDSSKRRNVVFNVVRYFPRVQTHEFINVGIILHNDGEFLYELLQKDDIEKLGCPAMINSKVLGNSLDSLEEYLKDKQSKGCSVESVTGRYKNILDMSFKLVHSGEEDVDDLLSKIYYDYVSYKLG